MVGYGSKMGIDATRKWPSEGHAREWPEVVKMDPATAQKVDAMWSRLGLGELIESPSVAGHIVAPMP
jgi:4-hydroxy-3-polyprenylbenzoate decarboxylase